MYMYLPTFLYNNNNRSIQMAGLSFFILFNSFQSNFVRVVNHVNPRICIVQYIGTHMQQRQYHFKIRNFIANFLHLY